MNSKKLIHQDSVVLVSGGARGITASCTIKLAEQSHAKFILLGRSSAEMLQVGFNVDGLDDAELKRQITQDLVAKGEKPAPQKIQKLFSAIRASQEINSTIEAVERAGGKAEYLRIDVADPALVDLLAGPVSRLGPITGIIHGAGTLVDKLIEKKTENDFETVYTPKISGLDNMLRGIDPQRLDFLVLFSSIVGFFGNVGQSDYAIANEILNKSAYQLKRMLPNCHVISFNWGPWDSGMVTPELRKVFESRNVTVIPTESGAQLLANSLLNYDQSSPPSNVQIVVGGAPVLPASSVSSDLRRYQIKRQLKTDDNPFLYDHVIGESPVLPATCGAAWVAYSCEQLYPGYKFFSLDKYRVLKGIVFDETLAKEHILDLQEVAKSDQMIQFEAMIWSLNDKGRKIYHYGLQVTLMREIPAAPQLRVEDGIPGEVISGKELYRNRTLFHGPSFQGVKKVLHISQGKLVMEVALPRLEERIQGQFPVYTANPFIYDAIVQCVLIWAQYFYQAPCLPSSLRRLVQYKSIPFDIPCRVTMEVESQTSSFVVGNIVVQDEHGVVYMRMEGLEGTISPHLNRFIGRLS